MTEVVLTHRDVHHYVLHNHFAHPCACVYTRGYLVAGDLMLLGGALGPCTGTGSPTAICVED